MLLPALILELRPLCSTGITRLLRSYGPLRHRDGRAWPSRVARCDCHRCRARLPVLPVHSFDACHRSIPRWNCRVLLSLLFPRNAAFPVCWAGRLPRSRFRGQIERSLALRPASSRSHQVTLSIKGSDEFVTSFAASIASGQATLPRRDFHPLKHTRIHGAPTSLAFCRFGGSYRGVLVFLSPVLDQQTSTFAASGGRAGGYPRLPRRQDGHRGSLVCRASLQLAPHAVGPASRAGQECRATRGTYLLLARAVRRWGSEAFSTLSAVRSISNGPPSIRTRMRYSLAGLDGTRHEYRQVPPQPYSNLPCWTVLPSLSLTMK